MELFCVLNQSAFRPTRLFGLFLQSRDHLLSGVTQSKSAAITNYNVNLSMEGK